MPASSCTSPGGHRLHVWVRGAAAKLAVEASRAQALKEKEPAAAEQRDQVGGNDDNDAEDDADALQRLEQFYDGCHSVMMEAKNSGNLTLSLSRHITDMFTLAAEHNVRLESFFVSSAIAVRVMEGIASRLTKDVVVSE